MSDSPKSDMFESRFSTPVNELDDHRLQPESLPRADSMAGHTRMRRETRRSTIDEQPGMLSVRDAYHASNARDFEYAIDDSDRPNNRSTSRQGQHEDGATSPAVGRRDAAFRRPRIVHEEPSDSGASVHSARSVSPPNSVEAFAGRRQRGRAGTANSIATSFITQYSPNIAPKERRPTFSSIHEVKEVGNDYSSEGSVEDDVCFPLPEETRTGPYNIDFDELDDFCARYKHLPNHVPIPFGGKAANDAPDQRARVFQDLCKGKRPDSEKAAASCKALRRPSGATVDGGDSILDEKAQYLQDGELNDASPLMDQINRWSFFSSALEDIIYAPDLGDLLMPGETFQHLFELGPDGGVWWLDMLMPSEEEVEAICKAFGIHGLTREDIIQQETREKVELFKSYYFVCFRSFYQMDRSSDCYMEPVNVYAVVFREGILTFTFCPSPHASNVRKRMGKLRDYVSLGADWICYALIDDIVDSYGPVIREVEHESEAIEDNVFTARAEDSRAILRQIGECRKTVMSLIRLLGGKADVIKGFAKRCNEHYSIAPRPDVGLYLSDIQDHVVTMMSNLSHFEKMLSRSHSNYLAQISVDNIAQGNRANEVLGKVTFIATILVPLNLVCGLFGMNVPVPGESRTSMRTVSSIRWACSIVLVPGIGNG